MAKRTKANWIDRELEALKKMASLGFRVSLMQERLHYKFTYSQIRRMVKLLERDVIEFDRKRARRHQ